MGLMYPRIDIVDIDSISNWVLAGTVAHQANTINDTQLTEHIMNIYEMFNKDKLAEYFPIETSNNVKYLKLNGNLRKNGKKGFIIYLESEISKSKENNFQILQQKFDSYLKNIIITIPDRFIDNFIVGTIDGRSSFDKSRHLVSIDIDRNIEKQNILSNIIAKSSIDAEINSRTGRSDASKSDQLRYSSKSLDRISHIGMLSCKRLADIKSALS